MICNNTSQSPVPSHVFKEHTNKIHKTEPLDKYIIYSSKGLIIGFHNNHVIRVSQILTVSLVLLSRKNYFIDITFEEITNTITDHDITLLRRNKY
jgi:hypothetical protein